jgi:hypothetical protein
MSGAHSSPSRAAFVEAILKGYSRVFLLCKTGEYYFAITQGPEVVGRTQYRWWGVRWWSPEH